MRHNFSLSLLTASAIATTAASFASIAARRGNCARIKRTGLHFKDGKDLESEAEETTLALFHDKPTPQNIDKNKLEPEAVGAQPEDLRDGPRTLLEAFLSRMGSSEASVPIGSIVVAGLSVPSLGVHEWQSYRLLSVHDKGVDARTGLVVKIPRRDLKEALPVPYGYSRYVTLYSKRYHERSGPVVVSPEEVGLKSLQEEVVASLLQALPMFGFWMALSFSWASMYNERYGGDFINALFRT